MCSAHCWQLGSSTVWLSDRLPRARLRLHEDPQDRRDQRRDRAVAGLRRRRRDHAGHRRRRGAPPRPRRPRPAALRVAAEPGAQGVQPHAGLDGPQDAGAEEVRVLLLLRDRAEPVGRRGLALPLAKPRRRARLPSFGEYVASEAVATFATKNQRIYRIKGEVAVDRVLRYESLDADLATVWTELGLPGTPTSRTPSAAPGPAVRRTAPTTTTPRGSGWPSCSRPDRGARLRVLTRRPRPASAARPARVGRAKWWLTYWLASRNQRPAPRGAPARRRPERGGEAVHRPPVHLVVRPVAGVQPDHVRLVAHGLRVRRRPAQHLGPVRRQPLGVVVAEPVRERVADHRIGEHPLVPGVGQARTASRRPSRRTASSCGQPTAPTPDGVLEEWDHVSRCGGSAPSPRRGWWRWCGTGRGRRR